jgi:hypothetical protein
VHSQPRPLGKVGPRSSGMSRVAPSPWLQLKQQGYPGLLATLAGEAFTRQKQMSQAPLECVKRAAICSSSEELSSCPDQKRRRWMRAL